MSNRAIIISITAFASLALALWILTFPLLVNKDNVKAELISSFGAATGMTLEIQGEPSLKVFPSPHITVDSLYVVNAPGTKEHFFLTIKNLDVWPVFLSLFKKQVIIKRVRVSGVEVSAEVMKDGHANWKEVSRHWKSGVFQQDNASPQGGKTFGDVVFELRDAHLGYSNVETGVSFDLSDISASFDLNASDVGSLFKLNFNYLNQPYAMSAQIGSGLNQFLSSSSSALKVDFTSGKTTLSYEGTGGYKDGHVFLNGDLGFTTDDMAPWIKLYLAQKGPDAPPAGYVPLPVSVKTKVVTQSDGRMKFADFTVGGTVVRGKGEIKFTPPIQIDVNAAVSFLDLGAVVKNGILFYSKDMKDNGKTGDNGVVVAGMTGHSMDISADIKIDEVRYNESSIRNINFSGEMIGGELTVPQMVATLPGDARLVFSGIGKMGLDGFMAEGQVDAYGNSFVEAMKLFDAGGLMLPSEDFQRFHMRANTLFAAKEIRFSEMAARIGNMVVNGGLILKTGERPSLQAALGVQGLNIDHMVSIWGLGDWKEALLGKNQIPTAVTEGIVSRWLKRLGYDMLVNASFENYTLGGKVYNKAGIGIAATAGKIELSGNRVLYNNSLFSGKVRLDVTKDTPHIDVNAAVDHFNLNDIFANGGKAVPVTTPRGRERLSTDVLNFKWFGMLNAAYNVKFGLLTYDALEAEDVAIAGNLQDQKITVDSFNGNLFGAAVAGKGAITGGAIPTMNVAADISALRVEKLASWLPLFKGVSGLCNINFVLSTNGVNLLAWAANLEGSAAMRGRDIEVRGFNLPGIIRAVSYVRTVADILNAVKRAFPNGNTVFNVVEGQWNIYKGVLDTSNTRVSNEQAVGVIVSKSDVVNWATNTSITFALKALDSANPPNMVVKMIGALDAPTLDFDTRSLEQYVNNKTSEKMLQQYGTH